MLQRRSGRSRPGDHQIGPGRYDLVRGYAHGIQFGTWPAIVDIDIAAGVPAQVLQACLKGSGLRLPALVALCKPPHQNSNVPRLTTLLCARKKRPIYSGATGKRDEPPSLHWPYPGAEEAILPRLAILFLQ